MEWIKVSERLPKDTRSVLVAGTTRDGDRFCCPARWDGEWYGEQAAYEPPGTLDVICEEGDRITHWCELPAPPEDE